LPGSGVPATRSIDDSVDALAPAAPQALTAALTEALALVRERAGGSAVDGEVNRPGDKPRDGAETVADHAAGTLAILEALRVDEATRLAGVLFGPGKALALDEIGSRFGTEVRVLVEGMRELLRLKDLTLKAEAPSTGEELEILRRMTLAMASDIRVVLIRLASRLQTLRHHARTKTSPAPAVARETLEVLAPLANRLGLGQLKWELEDLAFRFVEPELYRGIAGQLEERRLEREQFVAGAVERLRSALLEAGVVAEVSGRPKHLYSIYNKMRTKDLSFDEVQDLRAFRVLVADTRDCYTVLGVVHEIWPPIPREFDDYISRPKPNGYQSLHTVVIAEDDRPLEIQIRTRAMHQHAEFGVASHWRYKEASTGLAGSPEAAGARGKPQQSGPAGVQSTGQSPGPGAGAGPQARVEWMRQLLMWQQEVGATLGGKVSTAGEGEGERIYLLTPQAKVIELPAGSTPVDFAYHVHSGLGHRCRGARVDGHLVPLNTVLRNGQTIEVVVARAGSGQDGPSRDWLNPQLGFVRSPRARAKVRQWFNALELARDLADGREKVERLLQREGRTALSLDEFARRLKFASTDELFLAVNREEIGPRMLEEAVREAEPVREPDGEAEALQRLTRPSRSGTSGASPVLVVGVDFLMTQLARCCRPAPPDPIVGFVTRGRGVSVHRVNCRSFAEMSRRSPERVLETAWGDWQAAAQAPSGKKSVGSAARRVYPVDVVLRANDRQGLLRDVSDVFSRARLNVTEVRTRSQSGVAQMQFTIEVTDIAQLDQTLAAVRGVDGVIECRRH
jgi:GTP pyrophosphokinase